MQLKYKVIILAAVLIAAATGSFAIAKGWFKNETKISQELPDAASEWQKITEKYKYFKEGMHLTGTIRLYDSEKPEVIKEQKEMEMIATHSQLYYSLAGFNYYNDGKQLIQVDPVNQMVIMSKVDSNAAKQQQQMMPHMLNSFGETDPNSFNIVGTVEGNNKVRKLIIQNELSPGIKKYTVIYDPNTYLISEVEIEFWKENQVFEASRKDSWISKIQYTQKPFNGLDIQEMISKFITISDGQPVLTGEVKDYDLKQLN